MVIILVFCVFTTMATRWQHQFVPTAFNWFNDNGMKANASKFQYLTVFSNNISPNEYQNLELHVDNSVIKCANSIKLLGLIVDNRLNFTKYVDSVCTKAGRQVYILKRLSKILDNKSKINIYTSFIKYYTTLYNPE